MAVEYLISACVLFVLLNIAFWFLKDKIFPTSVRLTVPGLAPTHQSLGNLPDVKKFGSLHEFLVFLHKKYGNVASFYWKITPVVSICGSSAFKQVQHLFDKPPLIFENFESVIGEDSIQYANGIEAKERRRAYDKSFEQQQLKRYANRIIQIGQTTLKRIDLFESHCVKCPQKMALTIAAESIIVCCLCPVPHGELFDELSDLYGVLMQELESRLLQGKPYKNKEDTEFLKAKTRFFTIVKEMTKNRMQQLENTNFEEDEELLIDIIVNFHGDINQSIIESDVLTYMIGGFHTTGHTLAWCFYFLAKHNDCQNKLFEEIRSSKVDLSAIDDLFVKMKEMKYLRACIDESLRLSRLAPYAARYSSEPLTIGNYTIPADTPIILALGVSYGIEEVFPESEHFNPDRFMNKTLPSFSFEPFGFAGKRQCPGKQFSYLELSIWLIQFIGHYRIELVNPDQVVKGVYGLVTHMDNETPLYFIPR